jgi:lipoprotein-releasing system ATP-binding protein
VPLSYAKERSADTTNGDPILRATNLHRYLGSGEARTLILNGVNLSINRGEHVSIVGPSGSGKVTLLYLLGGSIAPTAPTATAHAFDPVVRHLHRRPGHRTSRRPRARLSRNQKIGFVFQFHYLLKEFTAQENVALPMFKLGHLKRDER